MDKQTRWNNPVGLQPEFVRFSGAIGPQSGLQSGTLRVLFEDGMLARCLRASETAQIEDAEVGETEITFQQIIRTTLLNAQPERTETTKVSPTDDRGPTNRVSN